MTRTPFLPNTSGSGSRRPEPTTDQIRDALREVLAAEVSGEALEQARDFLRRGTAMFHAELAEPWVVAAMTEAPTERLVLVAGLLPYEGFVGRQFPELETAILARLGRIVENDDCSPAGVERANALVALIHRLGAIERVPARELEWTMELSYGRPWKLYAALSDWCHAHDSLPGSIVGVIRTLRDDEVDSPILDRLAAWTVPSARGMLDLAGWENSYRSTGEPEYSAARERWARGERDPSDAEVLAPSMSGDSSDCAYAMELAAARDREGTLRALDDAIQEANPGFRVLLEGWRERVRSGA
jgi:hypothetical protein